jgi:bisphosphoglycerate-independent phosphoglycerate mutase (AlkP superfamily)
VVTADHGNAEEMISDNPKTGKREINTRHSLNPVPMYLFDPAHQGEYRLRENTAEQPLTLANLASTLFVLLGLPPPDDVEPPLFELS